jgi:hypothetical protein
MIDLAACGLTFLVILLVMLKKTSAGVAILALLAGVLLDQLLADWLIGFMPNQGESTMLYATATVHLILTFVPMLISIIAVKVGKHHIVPSLLASIALGFLITFFGTKLILPLPIVPEDAKTSGLLVFLQPYQNVILAASALIAVFEMTLSYNKSTAHHRSKKHKL